MITFYLEVITFLGSWNFYCFTFWQLSEDYRSYTDVHYSIHTIATRRDAVVGDIWWVELSETVEPGCLPLRVRALFSSLCASSVVEFMPHGRHLREGRLQPRNRPRWRTRSKRDRKDKKRQIIAVEASESRGTSERCPHVIPGHLSLFISVGCPVHEKSSGWCISNQDCLKCRLYLH